MAFFVPPIPQDPAYHDFADGHSLFGVANFWNVATNLPFLFVGTLGLLHPGKLHRHLAVPAYLLFCMAVFLVGLGSAWYHYAPDNHTLVWDRLPITIAFMALFALVIQDRVSVQVGRWMLWPLVIIGISSVLYWDWTELQGRGDLRVYGVVQFLPMLLIPLMLLTSPGRGLKGRWLGAALGAYVLAKLGEHFDAAIYAATGAVSGHSLKHLLGALAIFCALRALWIVSPDPD